MKIRNAKWQDLNFITSNWLKQYRGSIFARNMSKDVYFKNHNIILNKRLREGHNLVAVDPKDEYVIWGFASFDKRENVIHYIFVKNHFRGHGIGKRLFEEAIKSFDKDKKITITHLPKYKKYPAGWEFEYNPYTFLSEVEDENEGLQSSTGSEVQRADAHELSLGG